MDWYSWECDEPDELMKFWSAVVAACTVSWLSSSATNRARYTNVCGCWNYRKFTRNKL